jgi:hypothetical protein
MASPNADRKFLDVGVGTFRITLPHMDRNGPSEHHQGEQNGWAHSSDEIQILRANLWRGKELRGIAQLVERLVRN